MDIRVVTAHLIDANARLAKPEVFDPFHVPGRGEEMKSFALATFCATTFLIAVVFVPFEGGNLIVFGSIAIFAALSLYRGIRDREHRLNRVKAVKALHASLLQETRFS